MSDYDYDSDSCFESEASWSQQVAAAEYNNAPQAVRAIMDSLDINELGSYIECERLLKELKPYGYTFEYGLCGEPFDLKKLEL